MATVHSCDKCGDVIEEYNHATHVVALPKFIHILQDTKVSNKNDHKVFYDLCLVCFEDMRAWITGERLERIQE